MPERSRRILVAAALLLSSACSDASTTEAGEAVGGGNFIYNAMAAVSRGGADPQQLLGLSADSVQKALGNPSLVRRDGSAEIWQYRADACVLDLFLYGEQKQVEHVDLRDRGDGSPEAVQACFDDMLKPSAGRER